MTGTKVFIAQALLILINTLFFIKYGSRATAFYLPLAAAFFTLQFAILRTRVAGDILTRWRKPVFLLAVGGIILITLSAQWFIDPETLNVDRWSVISSFFEQLHRGGYPYGALSHLGNPPGPMPVYFLIAYPFYLTNTLCVLSAAGYLTGLFLLRKYQRYRPDAARYYCLMLTSPFLYWEIFTRSNVVTYAVMVWLALTAFEKISKSRLGRALTVNAIACGLLLSTRSVFIVAYAVYFLSCLRTGKFSVHVTYYLIAAAAFLLPLFTFFLIWPTQFSEINPFIVQSEYLLPNWIIYVFLAIVVVASLTVQQLKDRSFFSGIALFALIVVYFGYLSLGSGVDQAYFGSGGDLSYFLFSLPFLLSYAITQSSPAEPEATAG